MPRISITRVTKINAMAGLGLDMRGRLNRGADDFASRGPKAQCSVSMLQPLSVPKTVGTTLLFLVSFSPGASAGWKPAKQQIRISALRFRAVRRDRWADSPKAGHQALFFS